MIMMGCAQHAQQIRDAQDSFSQGAALDLARKFNIEETPGISDPAQDSHRYYALALGFVNEAIREGAADLKKDSLYSVALTIKALALWRIGDSHESKKAANDVVLLAGKKETANKVWPRDLGICKSLPVLSKIDALADQAREFAAQQPGERTPAMIDGIFADTEQTSDDLAKVVGDPVLKGHPYQFYLAEARCEIANVLQEAAAATAVFQNNGAKPYYKKYNKYRKQALDDLKNVAKTHGLGDGFQERADKMHTYYTGILQTLP
jgi:hypothetical protein